MLRFLPLLLVLVGCTENEHCAQVREWYLSGLKHEAWELAAANARVLDAMGCKPMPASTGGSNAK